MNGVIKRLRGSIISVLVAVLILATGVYAAEPATSLLTILYVNDYHGRINASINNAVDPEQPVGGAAYLAAMIKEARAKNPRSTLLLAAGDMFQGSAVSNLAHGAPVIEIMNELKFDAMVLGNHEFDWGMGVLEQIRREAHVPFLSANIVESKGHLLPGIKQYTILQRGHAKVAVIGVTTPDTEYTTKPDNVKGLSFLSPETLLPGLIRKVKQQGATIVILLSHLGLDADKRVASAVPGIDVIVGGHSHTVIPKPLKLDNTLILQAGAYGLYLGVLELVVNETTGRAIGYTKQSGLKIVSAGLQDKMDRKAALIVKEYNNKVKQKFSAVVGETSVDLTPGRGRESNLGDLTADAMRAATGCQIGFENSGGIRATIPAGKITMEELYTAFPFDNLLVSMVLSGKQVREALEQGGTMAFGGLQVSGITVTYDLSKAVGERVMRAEINGEPLDEGRSYTVVTNDFLAAGGDKVSALREGKNITYGDTLLDALVTYLKKHSPVSTKVEGRIRYAE
jgi:5'-nucleotidase / UDP-sugar diphosphatase